MRSLMRCCCLTGCIAVFVAAQLAMVQPAQGQGLLDRLEARFRQRSEGNQQTEDSVPAAQPSISNQLSPNQPSPSERVDNRMSLGLEAEERGFQAPYQIIVIKVLPGSPAGVAGIQANDQITAIDDRPVGTIDQIAVFVQAKKEGETLKVDLRRGDRAMQATAVFAESAENPNPEVSNSEVKPATLPMSRQLSPVGVNELPPERANDVTIDRPEPGSGRLGVTVENVATTPPEEGVPVKRGAVVVAVRDRSPAEIAGIRNGNVIVAIDGFIIQDAAALIDQISKTRPGQRIELGVYQAERLLRKSIVLADADGLTMEVAETPELNVPGQAKADESNSGGLMGSFGGAIGNLFGGTKPPATRPSDPPALLPAPLASTPLAPIPSTPALTPSPTTEVDQLKNEIQQLRQQLDALQRRLVELETTPER